MHATATVIDPESERESFALSLSTTDRIATTYFGFLRDVDAATSYRVRVERAGPLDALADVPRASTAPAT